MPSLGLVAQLGMLLKQPWARLACEGVFPILVRSRPVNLREEVAVVAKGVDPDAMIDGKPPDPRLFPQPALVGYVTIAGCTAVRRSRLTTELRSRVSKEFADFYPHHFVPDSETVFLWSLSRPRFLVRPRRVAYTGARVWVHIR